MKFVIAIMLIIVLLITAWFYAENVKLKKQVIKQEEELEISTNYIKQLNKKIAEDRNLVSSSQTSEGKIQKLMDTYLEEQNKNANGDADKVTLYSDQRRFLPDIVPIKGDFAISQRYSEEHPALDLAAPKGTEVVAVAAGEILSVYYDDIYGNVIMIDHLNEYATLYAHLATTFFEGKSTVEKGETIALVGNTGNSSAPHLHYEIMLEGNNVNPEEYIDVKK
ncbi:MAG: M23 family metallopeptidase [Candidatus Cloacimonetes bacterium]|jgi:murein DD-endopeptidase MepM/ murein hydrolase activator NlpD|nr:M23 family metallopeptidase [Candidatus Cloacimonadota bacterium]MBT4332267.1 M23 family metallopeptidase [Candidatus Cloacimonadota bacterium]MBT4576016.1 M23 family metallopeptidase [Candidatus Cloacimonadota bacterium]MBT5420591.1 M23 family metallopeptidase [Candidatus Cloacimonadota bacterium]